MMREIKFRGKNKDIKTVLNLVKRQEKQIELMLNVLVGNEFDDQCGNCCQECERDYDTLYNCIKKHFEEEVKK